MFTLRSNKTVGTVKPIAVVTDKDKDVPKQYIYLTSEFKNDDTKAKPDVDDAKKFSCTKCDKAFACKDVRDRHFKTCKGPWKGAGKKTKKKDEEEDEDDDTPKAVPITDTFSE